MYDVDDAVAKIDGYIISIAGAAPHVGEKRMVRIDQVGRTAASALLLDETGEVVRPATRPAGSRGGGGSRRSPESGEPGRAVERARKRSRGRRAPADSEDADARREAGLSETPTVVDSEPEEGVPAGSAEEHDLAQDEGADDGLQSKPRRRGRRGGRRRSAAKAKAAPE
jgi:ribonuclease G